ncbi:MAG: tetratricopeptide repeat protein [Chloroflexi bacterium]|nr:tetratricopeptide repeat protein [Chloroflexota bacterium]
MDHFILVIDDYHLVANTPAIGHVMSRFLQLTGENVHLILASRNLPDLPDSPLMIARNQVGGLSFEELSFHPEEIQQFFQQNKGIQVGWEDAAALARETEGWIAAIHLTNGHPGILPQLHPLESTRELFDFFSKEIMLRQPEQVRRFVLMTSLFDTFDVSLCEKVLDPLLDGEKMDWPHLFEVVQSGHLFSIPLDNEGRWMRYHNLFQHFLRSQQQYENPVLAWHIQKKLARVYEEQQAWEEALQIYAKLDDHENLVRLLIQIGFIFIQSGRILSLANWLDKLPVDVVYSQPILLSLLGIIYATRGDNHQALKNLSLAEAKLLEAGNEVEWATTLVRRAEIYRQLNQFDRTLADVEQVLELFKESTNPELKSNFAEAQRIKGLALFALGHMKDALVWLEDSLRNYRILGIKTSTPVLETELGVVHRRLGEFEITERYYASALQSLENTGNTGWKARLLNNMGVLYYLTGQLDKAYAHLQEALVTAERSGYAKIQTNILISLGDLLTDLADFESAYVYYDKALTLATHLGHSLSIFYASLGEARLKRLKGEALLAIEGLKQAEVSQINLGIYERALFNLELGICWLDINKMDMAVVILRDAVMLFKEGGNQMEQILASFWLQIALSAQSADVATPELRELLPPQRDWQKPTPLMISTGRAGRWLKKRNSRILKDASLKLFFDQAERILESIPQLYGNLAQFSDRLQPIAPRLEVFSFGDVQVCHNHQIVELSDWQTREARDLFFFLLQSPPLTKEQIALEFWPDISPARIKMRFKINIYRIRRALGQDVVIFENECYRINRAINYYWDREKFDELYQAAQQKAAGMERIRLLEQAVALIKGSYLANLEAEWAIPYQLKYQDLYLETGLELAGLYLGSDQARACLNTARTILRMDPLQEAAHRLIIQAYASLHDPAGLKLQYRQYQQIMESELGMEPSQEMRTLYKQLIGAI